MVDDTTQIPSDLHQSLLCATRQVKSWLAWGHIEGFGEDHSESASYHQPPVAQISPLAAGMLRSRRDVIEAMRNWGDASRNPSRSPWPFQRLHTRLGEGMKSRALRMVAIQELWAGHFGNGQFSQCQLKVLCSFLCWDDVCYLFFCWCWTLKSPRPLLINSLEQQKHPMGQGGMDTNNDVKRSRAPTRNGNCFISSAEIVKACFLRSIGTVRSKSDLDHLKQWSQMIYSTAFFSPSHLHYHILPIHLLPFKKFVENWETSFPEAQSFEHFLLK